jgi:hypothetical protein
VRSSRRAQPVPTPPSATGCHRTDRRAVAGSLSPGRLFRGTIGLRHAVADLTGWAVTYLQTLTGKFTVALVSSNLLSLRFALAYYAGGAHDINKLGGLSFKVSTGAAIAFADLFTSPAAALPVLNTQSQALLTALLGGDLTWSPAAALDKVSDAWVLTTGGLELSWARGTVGPESAGPVAITIPWASLAAVVNPTGPAGVLLP